MLCFMSFQVDKARIVQFKKDRALLPYNDLEIAARMRVDRSNYSKAVTKGPITYSFLKKFYDAFHEELTIIKESVKADLPNCKGSQSNDLLRRFDEMLAQVDRLIAGQTQLREQVNSLEGEMDKVLERIPRIENLITQLAMCMAPGII